MTQRRVESTVNSSQKAHPRTKTCGVLTDTLRFKVLMTSIFLATKAKTNTDKNAVTINSHRKKTNPVYKNIY